MAAWLLLGVAATAHAQAPTPPTEAAVKAAYLYKFLAYVEWPASALPAPDTPLVVGVVGADAIGAELQAAVAGRTVNGHPVVARPLAGSDTYEGLHAIFVGRAANLSTVLPRVSGRPVLVVTESGLEGGSMLNFVAIDGRIRFEAAPAVAERVGLKLGSRLLGVAERVLLP